MSEPFDLEKRARELVHNVFNPDRDDDDTPRPSMIEAMKQLAHEAADARAEEIAKAIEGCCYATNERSQAVQDALLARSFISKPKEPEKRETVLERTLRAISSQNCSTPHVASCPQCYARRALEWKP